jgi:hypothetical protein
MWTGWRDRGGFERGEFGWVWDEVYKRTEHGRAHEQSDFGKSKHPTLSVRSQVRRDMYLGWKQ